MQVIILVLHHIRNNMYCSISGMDNEAICSKQNGVTGTHDVRAVQPTHVLGVAKHLCPH